MPTPTLRSSLTKGLEDRYSTQRVGSAFDVKQTLNTKAGQIVDATSMQGAEFQSPSGFEVKAAQNGTQMKDAQGLSSKELSKYMQGFTNKKYKG
jgi:hypothetical protein